jgi:hypothetical protein
MLVDVVNNVFKGLSKERPSSKDIAKYNQEKEALLKSIAVKNVKVGPSLEKKLKKLTPRPSQSYYSKALALNDKGNPKYFSVLQKAAVKQLKEMKKETAGLYALLKVEILAGSDSCSHCKELNGKTYTIDEVLSQMPIPCPQCTNSIKECGKYPFCRCEYVLSRESL